MSPCAECSLTKRAEVTAVRRAACDPIEERCESDGREGRPELVRWYGAAAWAERPGPIGGRTTTAVPLSPPAAAAHPTPSVRPRPSPRPSQHVAPYRLPPPAPLRPLHVRVAPLLPSERGLRRRSGSQALALPLCARLDLTRTRSYTLPSPAPSTPPPVSLPSSLPGRGRGPTSSVLAWLAARARRLRPSSQPGRRGPSILLVVQRGRSERAATDDPSLSPSSARAALQEVRPLGPDARNLCAPSLLALALKELGS